MVIVIGYSENGYQVLLNNNHYVKKNMKTFEICQILNNE